MRTVMQFEILSKFPTTSLLFATSGTVVSQIGIGIIVKEPRHSEILVFFGVDKIRLVWSRLQGTKISTRFLLGTMELLVMSKDVHGSHCWLSMAFYSSRPGLQLRLMISRASCSQVDFVHVSMRRQDTTNRPI